MDRNIALEMVRVTEAAALAAAQWMGKGDAIAADKAAIEAMHHAFMDVDFSGRIAIGEGDQGIIPLLYTGQSVGSKTDEPLDLAVDALECTKSVAFGRSNAMAVVAITTGGDFLTPPSSYMEKLAVSPEAAGVIDLNLSTEDNLRRIAEAKGYSLSDLTVVILDRQRHAELIETIRRIGSRIHLIPDGDVAAAVATATVGSGIDVLMGTGGAAAGVIAAAALSCLGGEIQTRVAPTDDHEADLLKVSGHADLDRIYRTGDLVRGDNVMFAATGITDGDVLNGVTYRKDGACTHSLVMRSKTKTRRYIVTEHYFQDSPAY